MAILDRRGLLRFGALGAAALLAGCDRFGQTQAGQSVFSIAERMSYRTQRWLLGADRLAPEYPAAAITDSFRANGTTNPSDEAYQALAKDNFANWKLAVSGLVDRPLALSLADLRAMPARAQITRHDCVEGWSCIGKWNGVPLAHVLDAAGVGAAARYVVFHCADTLANGFDRAKYYESVDMSDARHPQTILAYDMNDAPLTVPYGAPLRLRVERQLGYKMAKYLMRIEVVADFSGIGAGRGGYWEDRGYDWYAGI
jgi:DMSO/TMAO reductase YedYZ molybdopterin-dependent catalytic subunit